MKSNGEKNKKFDQVIAESRKQREQRQLSYREQALKMYPWICGRCAREFNRTNLQELTVHHRDHNHDNNPVDGSNWELLCIYCHENEHARITDYANKKVQETPAAKISTHNPFANLKKLLDKK